MKTPNTVISVIKTLKDAGHKAFLVGGCVRDMIREVEPHDYDVATDATPAQVIALFPKVLPTGIAHGTVTVQVHGQEEAILNAIAMTNAPEWDSIEVTTFRSEEGYSDGRRPDEVRFETDTVADLARRDFTINAMAYDPTTHEIVDPFGGTTDLVNRVVRCVGDADARFGEDGLRCMRAIRFATTFDFALEVDTYQAIESNLNTFRKVAAERVQSEFTKILMSDFPTRGMKLLLETGLMETIFGSEFFDWFPNLTLSPRDLETRLAILVKAGSGNVESLAPLKLPTLMMTRIKNLLDHPAPKESASDFKIREWLHDFGTIDFFQINQAFAVSAALDTPLSSSLRARVETLTKDPLFVRDLALDGNEIMAVLGLKKGGAVVGRAARMLMAAVLIDPTCNTPEILRSILNKEIDSGLLDTGLLVCKK